MSSHLSTCLRTQSYKNKSCIQYVCLCKMSRPTTTFLICVPNDNAHTWWRAVSLPVFVDFALRLLIRVAPGPPPPRTHSIWGGGWATNHRSPSYKQSATLLSTAELCWAGLNSSETTDSYVHWFDHVRTWFGQTLSSKTQCKTRTAYNVVQRTKYVLSTSKPFLRNCM